MLISSLLSSDCNIKCNHGTMVEDFFIQTASGGRPSFFATKDILFQDSCSLWTLCGRETNFHQGHYWHDVIISSILLVAVSSCRLQSATTLFQGPAFFRQGATRIAGYFLMTVGIMSCYPLAGDCNIFIVTSGQ